MAEVSLGDAIESLREAFSPVHAKLYLAIFAVLLVFIVIVMGLGLIMGWFFAHSIAHTANESGSFNPYTTEMGPYLEDTFSLEASLRAGGVVFSILVIVIGIFFEAYIAEKMAKEISKIRNIPLNANYWRLLGAILLSAIVLLIVLAILRLFEVLGALLTFVCIGIFIIAFIFLLEIYIMIYPLLLIANAALSKKSLIDIAISVLVKMFSKRKYVKMSIIFIVALVIYWILAAIVVGVPGIIGIILMGIGGIANKIALGIGILFVVLAALLAIVMSIVIKYATYDFIISSMYKSRMYEL